MSAIIALQKYALGGKVPGPFFRNLPVYVPAIFPLLAWRVASFDADAARLGTFDLLAWTSDTFDLEA